MQNYTNASSSVIDNPLLLKLLYYYPWTSIKTLYRMRLTVFVLVHLCVQCSAVVCGVMRTQCTSPGAPVRVSCLTVSPKANSLLQLPPAALWLRCTAGPGDQEPPSSPTAEPSACSALKQVLETGAMFSALFAFSLHCMTQSMVVFWFQYVFVFKWHSENIRQCLLISAKTAVEKVVIKNWIFCRDGGKMYSLEYCNIIFSDFISVLWYFFPWVVNVS